MFFIHSRKEGRSNILKFNIDLLNYFPDAKPLHCGQLKLKRLFFSPLLLGLANLNTQLCTVLFCERGGGPKKFLYL